MKKKRKNRATKAPRANAVLHDIARFARDQHSQLELLTSEVRKLKAQLEYAEQKLGAAHIELNTPPIEIRVGATTISHRDSLVRHSQLDAQLAAAVVEPGQQVSIFRRNPANATVAVETHEVFQRTLVIAQNGRIVFSAPMHYVERFLAIERAVLANPYATAELFAKRLAGEAPAAVDGKG